MEREKRSGRDFQESAGRKGVGATLGPEVLTSRDNKWLKEFRVALRGGVATASGAVGLEGVRLVEEALGSGCRVEAVLFGESGKRHWEQLARLIAREDMVFPVLQTTDRLFEGIADTEHPQGVAALVVPRSVELEELLEGTKGRQQLTTSDGRETREIFEPGARPCAPLIVVLAGVQDPGNVGTIVRTAAAFGASGLVTAATGQSGTASPFSPKAMRASAGAALHLPIVSGVALGILLTQLKLKGVRTVASFVHEEFSRAVTRDHQLGGEEGTLTPWEVNWCEGIALLVGNEGAGLPLEVVRAADARIHIPMATRVESLNAAAAAAVVLYEAFRQRKNK